MMVAVHPEPVAVRQADAAALTLRGVTKSFGATRVLHGIDLTVPQGSFTAVLGPSGCGKTTMLRLIAGFLEPDSGTIAFGDRIVAGAGGSVPPQKRQIGYVPQEGALFPHLSVSANVGFGLPRPTRRHRDRIDELLDLVGLDRALRHRMPHELSGGQQQRVALARALAPTPSIVLLDEPFSSLDAGLREETRRAVAQALRAAKATAILVTHDQSEALSLADQVAVMRAGRLIQVASPRTVYESPQDAGVATFVGAAMLLDASVQADRTVTTPLGPVDVTGELTPGTGSLQIVVRPEQIQILPPGQGVSATVADVSYYGHDAAVRLAVAPATTAAAPLQVTARVMGRDAPQPGAVVGLAVAGPVTTLA